MENTVVEVPARAPGKDSLFSKFLDLTCSVRLGVVLLILLGLACFIGMLVMQQNVDGFETYYAQLTPSQRLVYGGLGLFDIYHAWYFNALLGALSINIILASIDRFPKTWALASNPKVTVPMHWLRGLNPSKSLIVEGEKDHVIQQIKSAYRKAGWGKTKTAEKSGRTFIFAESGRWNRFGAYAVHVGLLTIFAGGFLTAQFGHTGQMPLSPGQSSDRISDIAFELDQMRQVEKQLPFEVYCTDIQQILIRKEDPISAGNTIDWLTRITIKDETGTHDAVVQMNRPFDYRGYRFFQASFIGIGRARNITLRMKDKAGNTKDLTLKRDGAVKLEDGTNISFAGFRGNFSLGEENLNEDTSGYPNPAAILQVTPPNEEPQTAYAFGANMANIPVADKLVGGYSFQLVDFEKVADQHVLSVQRDPGSNVVYVGFTLLVLTLGAVFFFSHKKVWTAIESKSDGRLELTIAGNTNRNKAALEERLNIVVKDLRGQSKETL
ncbi:MAG: cytochrome c biogenesis protein ResB [Acidobacteriota bacterium]|nr:cytochrome c biogenesis protein ResB [Acidobacteriota bacterium]